MKLNKLAASLIAVSALAFGSSAQAINVGGVVWNPDDAIFDFSATSNLFETIGVNVGDSFSGYGQITSINASGAFCPTCQLTYEFGGFTLVDAATGPADLDFAASGGWLKVYVQDTGGVIDGPFTAFDANIKSSATDGTLWLDLLASSAVFGAPVTLIGSVTIPNSNGTSGQGDGYFDVVGGLAAANLDTNSQEAGTDLTYTTSFQPLNGPVINDDVVVATHFGTNEVFGESVTVPEPATLALLGLGLVGLGMARRAKKAA